MEKMIEELNKGVLVSKENIMNLNNQMIRKYIQACRELYNLSYIDSPCILNKRMFIKALIEEFSDYIPQLVSNKTMKIPDNPLYFDFLLKMYSDDDEFTQVITWFKDILYTRGMLKSLTSCKGLKFRKDEESKIVNPRINISINITTKSKYLSNELMNLHIMKHDGKIIEYNFSHIYLKSICDELHITDYEERKANNQSIFFPNMTFNDDCTYLPIMLDGTIDLKHGNDELRENREKLYRRLREYTNTLYKTYLNELFVRNKDEIERAIQEYKETIKAYKPKDYYITNFSVYYEVSIYTSFINALGYEYYDFKIGTAIFDYDTGEELNPLYRLLGYSGEFISEKSIKENGIKVVEGFPIILDNGKKYYPIFNIPEIAENYEKPQNYVNIKQEVIKGFHNYFYKSGNPQANKYILSIVDNLLSADLDIEPTERYKDITIANKEVYLEQALNIYRKIIEDYELRS